MTIVDPRFGPTLARFIRERGTTGRALAAAANIAPSYVSEMVNGRKMPTLGVAESLDTALAAAGELVTLAVTPEGDDHDRIAAATINPARVDDATIVTFDRMLAMQRSLDDQLGSKAMLGPTAAHMSTIVGMVRTTVGPQRPQLMGTASNWAQFQGWLYTSTGQWEQARAAFHQAMEWAAEAGDPHVHATALSYLGHVAWLTGEPANTVSKAVAALRNDRVYPGQRAYDAYQAARAYATLGHVGDADRHLGLADRLAHESDTFVGEVPPCQYYRAPWYWLLERGLVKLAMAQRRAALNREAADDLRAGLGGMPAEMSGADWAAEYMVHAATAFARSGERGEAVLVLDRADVVAQQTHSRRVGKLVARERHRLQACVR